MSRSPTGSAFPTCSKSTPTRSPAARSSAPPWPARSSRARRCLFADEPTGALDSGSTEELLRLFGTVNGAGQTIVMVTHSVRAASCAGRVLFLRDGAVAQELTRGTDTETAFYRRIADALTASQTGGGAV